MRAGLRHALDGAVDDSALSKLLGVRGALLDDAVEASRRLAHGRPLLLPAWQRYTGVVWSFLDPGTLRGDQRERILIPSGVYGLTTAEDPIADYRLKLSVALPGVGGLARFWRPHVSRSLAASAVGATVVEMLPDEHVAAIDLDAISEQADVVRVSFIDRSGSRSVGHAAKAVKGIAARTVIEDGIDALSGLRFEGWKARRVPSGFEIVAP